MAFPSALRGEKIISGCGFRNRRPKDLVISVNFYDYTLELENEPYKSDFETILYCIKSASPIPDRFYRKGLFRTPPTPDKLLQHDGIKHLHLGGQHSDVLLFLVEFKKRIVLLEVPAIPASKANHLTACWPKHMGAVF